MASGAWLGLKTCHSSQMGEGAGLYYLTFTVVEWLPVFVAEEPCRLITDSLKVVSQLQQQLVTLTESLPIAMMPHDQVVKVQML